MSSPEPANALIGEDAGGEHLYIPLAWVSSVEGDRVRLDEPAAEAERNWRAAP